MRINRGIVKNSGLVTDKEIGLKNWHPICRDRGQADLGSSSMIAATLLTDLGHWSEKMIVQREKENREEKDYPDQVTRIESSFHRGNRRSILLSE